MARRQKDPLLVRLERRSEAATLVLMRTLRQHRAELAHPISKAYEAYIAAIESEVDRQIELENSECDSK